MAGRPGRAGGHRRRADRRARPPRQRLVRAAGLLPPLLRPRRGPSPRTDAPLLPLAVPLAVCEAAEAVAPVRCQVKWPNDVWIDERKVAGVLVEARPDEGWAVIGVGAQRRDRPEDEFPPELRETATSLLPTEAEGGLPPGGAPGVRRPLDALNDSLGRWLEASDDEVLSAFRARDALAGRRISWDGGEGVAKEVDERGHLVVERADGERLALGAGEVHLAIEALSPRLLVGRLGGLELLVGLGRRAVVALGDLELVDLELVSRRPRAARRSPRRPCRSSARRPILRAALALAPATAPAGLGEVAEQLAGDRGGLAGGAHPRPAQDLLALGRVGDAGGEQGRGEAAVLVAGGVDQPAGVAAVRPARMS